MRVHELAKKLGMENRDLIPELKRLGIVASSHSSALDDVAVQKVLQKLTPKAKPAPKAGTKRDEVESEAKLQPAKPEALKREVVTKESAPRKRATPPREPAKGPTQKSPPVVIEEPPKVDKRRILFKRKKGDDEVAAELAAGTGPAVDTLGALGAPFQAGGLAPALPGGPAERVTRRRSSFGRIWRAGRTCGLFPCIGATSGPGTFSRPRWPKSPSLARK